MSFNYIKQLFGANIDKGYIAVHLKYSLVISDQTVEFIGCPNLNIANKCSCVKLMKVSFEMNENEKCSIEY